MGTSEADNSRLERLRNELNANIVYGDPISSGEKTVIPVAKVRYGFGTSFGGETNSDEQSAVSTGGAGGGGVATPVGVVEVTDSETKLVRFHQRRREIALVIAGLLIGLVLRRRR